MKIFITARFEPEEIEVLKQQGDTVGVHDWRQEGRFLDADGLVQRLDGVDVLVVEGTKVTEDVITRCPDLKMIVVCRGNPVNVDIQAATKCGVLVTHTPGRNADAVADLTVAFIIMAARHILPASHVAASGQWPAKPRGWAYRTFQGFELGGRKAGLVGLGAVGKKVAQRLCAFDMKILAYDPYVEPDVAAAIGARLVSLDVLMQESDFVSLHVHVTEETRGIIGARQFALIKPTAFLINTARAAVVDEIALLAALREKRIAGAALDVFHVEPLPADNPLLQLDNVVLTPHIGGATRDVIGHQSRIVVEELRRLRMGELPRFVFNREVLERLRPDVQAFLNHG